MESQHMRERFPHLSSDEAPDTGEDTDEDMITNYLGVGPNVTNQGHGDGLVPAIQVTPHSPNANRILEDNLLQLAQIQDLIQILRMENASSANATNSGVTGDVALYGLSSTLGGDRLSTSCPSLNNSTAESPFADISQTPPSTTTDNSTPSHQDKNRNFSQNGNNDPYRRRKNDGSGTASSSSGMPSSGKSVHRKRQGRQRSMSVSSNDSEEDIGIDRVDSNTSKVRQRSASNVNARSSTAPIVITSSGATNNQNNNSTASSVYHRLMHGGRHSQKNSHLQAQLPTLHKSVSTPSIVVEQSGGKSGQTARYPEPTHAFLQRLLADHDWAGRRSVSDTDSDDDGNHPASSEFGHTAANRPPSQFTHNLADRKFVGNTGSPQLSWAEFLQDDPNLEDDDSRKRRRKKERSSLFFRKKKDKTTKQPPTGFFDATHHHHQQSVGSSGPAPLKTHGKISSAMSLGHSASSSGLIGHNRTSNAGQGSRFNHYSNSMSNLRKAPGDGIGGPNLPSSSFPAPSSNFYLLRGDTSSPRSRRRNAQSQWSKVGRKLGVMKSHGDERDDYGHEETTGLLEGEFGPGEEFPEGGPANMRDLETAPFLRIQEDEPEHWQQTVRSEDLAGLSAADIKRQEHMYEFIITESNHCQVLKVIQKIFVEGMHSYLNVAKEVIDQMFPCLDQLIEIHFQFLEELRIRQNEQSLMGSIADIILRQFSGENGEKWREAYSAFCSGHNDAIGVYKDLMKSDRRFEQFIRQCLENPLLKKKGLPECILFVTTRITKYPLLIEPLIKHSKELPAEEEQLKQSINVVREILRDVNAKVAIKERKHRLLEIYNKIDPRSTIMHNGKKFKKSDILSASRTLMFEGSATLHQSRARIQVIIIVLSDIAVFLQESNQKFCFIIPEGKPSVIPVRKLLALEKLGGSSKSLQLLLTSEREPEIYDLDILQPPTRDDWISGIRNAVDACSPGFDSDDPDFLVTEEKRKRYVQSKYLRLKRLTAELRGKDMELARLLEDKMKIMRDMLSVVGTPDPLKDDKLDYTKIVRKREESTKGSAPGTGSLASYTKEQLLSAVQEASILASSLYSSGSSLSRSVSSVGERYSVTYTSPILPKRAETFGGFDIQQNPNCPKTMSAKEIDIEDGREEELLARPISPMFSTNHLPNPLTAKDETEGRLGGGHPGSGGQDGQCIPPFLHLDPDQQQAAVQMTHYLNSLTCMVSEHFTSLESLKVELAELREKSTILCGRYKHNQLLEDLRTGQEKLTQEKKVWATEKETQEEELKRRIKEMNKQQSEITNNLKDVSVQREHLYRMLDALKSQGIEIGPNMTVLKSDPQPSKPQISSDVIFYSEMSPSPDQIGLAPQNSSNLMLSAPANIGVRKSSSMSLSSGVVVPQATSVAQGGSLKKESMANLHLMSATNETKGSQQEIKQQIPVKLSKLSVSTGSGSGSKDKSKRSASSTSSLSLVSSSSKLISSTANISKPDSIQQMLPFKLSETEASSGQQSGSVKSAKLSPKQQQQQRYQYTSFTSSDGAQGRGSSPTLLAGNLVHAGSSNTLPKSTSSNGSKQIQKVPYTNSDDNTEDKVIYF